jgi:glycine cleavage system H protein
MSKTPDNLFYTKEHEWVESLGNNRFRIGITDYAQSALGDIVYIQLPKMDSKIVAGSVCGEVESTKSVSEIYAPISGKVVAVNQALDKTPESMNADAYGSGWIAEIEAEADFDLKTLMSAAEYQEITA